MEPPYDTRCQKYPPKSGMAVETLKQIQNDTVRILGKSIPGLMTGDTGDNSEVLRSNLMTSFELSQNRTLQMIYREIVKRYEHFGLDSCHIRCLMSKISFGKDEQFRFRLTWPDGLKVTIEFVSKNTVIDYIVYICSSVGIWFGISAFSVLNQIPLQTEISGDDSLAAIRADFLLQLKKQQLINDCRFQKVNKRLEISEHLRRITKK